MAHIREYTFIEHYRIEGENNIHFKKIKWAKSKTPPIFLALHKSFILWWGCFEAVEHSFKNDTDEVSKKDDADEDSKKDDDPKDVEFLFRGPL